MTVAPPMAAPGAPAALAAAAWAVPADVRIDLRYEPDEAALLDPPPERVYRALLDASGDQGASLAAHYPLDDLYGGARGAPVVSRFFGCAVTPDALTFGAGVGSLLHALAGLAAGGVVVAPEHVHPDLEVWAAQHGGEPRLVPEPATAADLIRAIAVERPVLVHLDRPDFTGQVLAPEDIAEIADAAAGAVVLVDESAAPYLGARASAARLAPELDNLIVLRGFTKAYSWGGLRVGYAVASPGCAGRVRELVPPMQVAGLALGAALRMLAAGDVFGALRARIREVKPATAALLRDAQLDVLDNASVLPWVAIRDAGGRTAERLLRAGIRGLAPVPVPGAGPPALEVLRLTVPLAASRLALLRELLADL
jgi:histidinol-phosphate/aromatic aminotransferase/cobyric acid decarboxylase-like protein